MPLLGPDEGENDFWWINWTIAERAWPDHRPSLVLKDLKRKFEGPPRK